VVQKRRIAEQLMDTELFDSMIVSKRLTGETIHLPFYDDNFHLAILQKYGLVKKYHEWVLIHDVTFYTPQGAKLKAPKGRPVPLSKGISIISQ